MKGKWAFGQYAPMMTADEMEFIFKRVVAKGWLHLRAC